MIWSDRLYKADISFSSSGDNTIIAAPGSGKQICIDFVQYVPTAATVIQLKDGSTAYGGAYPHDAKQGLTIENAIHNPDGIITLSENTAFVINSTVATQTSGLVRYRIRNMS